MVVKLSTEWEIISFNPFKEKNDTVLNDMKAVSTSKNYDKGLHIWMKAKLQIHLFVQKFAYLHGD